MYTNALFQLGHTHASLTLDSCVHVCCLWICRTTIEIGGKSLIQCAIMCNYPKKNSLYCCTLTLNYFILLIVIFYSHSGVSCSLLTHPMNGSVSPGDNSFETIRNYTCNDGFKLIGFATTTCRFNGVWSAPQPTCQSKCLVMQRSRVQLPMKMVARVFLLFLILRALLSFCWVVSNRQ